MKKYTRAVKKKRLQTAIDNLTEENQLYVLGVLEALVFAQSVQEKAGQEPVNLNDHIKEGAYDEL
ncbi:MAG: hypothetical protein LBJ00_10765 [Planctomycetaceae bacterium]|jgi:hypothetical protein|nr:hypothetical protein [Planctomycetaceae bacterium]